MFILSQAREQAAAAARVVDYLQHQHLDLDDLLLFGGEDLSDPDNYVRDRARAVERGWGLLAKLHLKFEDFVAVVAPQEEGRRPCPDAGHISNTVT